MNKEEPKQEDKLCHYSGLSSPLVYAEEYKQAYEYIGECTGNDGNGCFMDSPGHNCGCFTKVPKKETIEQAAKDTTKKYINEREKQTAYLEFIMGAKWQKEQNKNKYTEEEVRLAYLAGYDMAKGISKITSKQFIQSLQNKKK
jgi:hypothetical protein